MSIGHETQPIDRYGIRMEAWEAERDRRIAAIEALPVTQDDLYEALNSMTLRCNEAALGALYAFAIKGDAESVLELLMKQAELERASRAIDEANESMEEL